MRPNIILEGKIYLILLNIIALDCMYANASILYTQSMDTILLKKGSVVLINGKLISPVNDTILSLADSIIKTNSSLRSARDLYQLQKKAEQTRIGTELSRMVFKKHSPPNQNFNDLTLKRASSFAEYNGKIISDIRIKRLGVFGTHIDDTTLINPNEAEKFLNGIHIQTRDWVIRKNLLFEPGDAIDPPLLAENERFLRDLRFLENAWFLVIPDSLNMESVSLILIVKDVFPWAANVNIMSINETSFSTWNNNMLGIGHRLDLGLTYRSDIAPAFSFRNFNYSVNNIAGSLVDGSVFYLYSLDSENSGINLKRNLIPGRTKYLYGMSLMKINQFEGLNFADTNFNSRIGLNDTKVNLGRILYLSKSVKRDESPIYLIFQTSYRYHRIISIPVKVAQRATTYYDYNRFLGSISLSQTNILTSNYFEGFGKTEDITYGFLLQITGGVEFGDSKNRRYAEFRVAKVNYSSKLGYFGLDTRIGGFIDQSGISQGLLNISLGYTSLLYRIGLYHHRHIIAMRYLKGFNRFDDEFLYLNKNSGFYKFESGDLKGHERLNASIGSQIYTPWYLLGFRINLISYFELGVLPAVGKSFFKSVVYPGIGCGIKVKNENLVFETLQLNFTWYPNTLEKGNNFNFFTGNVTQFQFPDLHNYSVTVPEFR